MVDKALAQRDLAEIFENLEREQKTDASYLIQWIKDLWESHALTLLDRLNQSDTTAEQKSDMKERLGCISLCERANLVGNSREEDIQLKIMFKKAKSSRRVRLEEFKAIIMKLAKEKSRTFEELTRQLTEEGPGLMRAATEGISAFRDALRRN